MGHRVTATDLLVQAMNAEQRQVASDHWTKSTGHTTSPVAAATLNRGNCQEPSNMVTKAVTCLL